MKLIQLKPPTPPKHVTLYEAMKLALNVRECGPAIVSQCVTRKILMAMDACIITNWWKPWFETEITFFGTETAMKALIYNVRYEIIPLSGGLETPVIIPLFRYVPLISILLAKVSASACCFVCWLRCQQLDTVLRSHNYILLGLTPRLTCPQVEIILEMRELKPCLISARFSGFIAQDFAFLISESHFVTS